MTGVKPATLAKRFVKTLKVPTGRLAGEPVRLAPYQNRFIDGAFAPGINVGALSVGRGNGKSTLSAALALGELLGAWSDATEREILIAAKTQQQAQIAWHYVASFIRTLPEDVQAKITIRRQPRFEIQFDDDRGPHILRAISADGKSALGSSPTLALMDERGHWPLAQGDELEAALLTGLSKRDGKALIISTSASSDAHPFSMWLDRDAPGVYRQEHRPEPGLPADDVASLITANPGTKYGIGPSLKRLKADAALALERGGSALSRFRLLPRNERVQEDSRDILISLDDWLKCETDALPPKAGPCVIGLDLGGSASMSAASYFWPETERLECYGTFPSNPGLDARGQADAVGDLYVQMQQRRELAVMGDKTVPIVEWIEEVLRRAVAENVACIVADRFKSAELGEAIDKAGNRAPVIWRGMGFKDGSEDVERLRRHIFDGRVKSKESYLLRHAFSEAVVLIDPANNAKPAKGRSMGRIDAACATMLAVAEGARMLTRPAAKPGRLRWA
ncbi:terminase large subunit domain-containing protein [Pseudooceanicola sp.]|uniref:terminase large subunit domain-containing protein n=1 Tax=Pseudooceanicola sp. TaxID=1914328 RepID=UPI0035145387